MFLYSFFDFFRSLLFSLLRQWLIQEICKKPELKHYVVLLSSQKPEKYIISDFMILCHVLYSIPQQQIFKHYFLEVYFVYLFSSYECTARSGYTDWEKRENEKYVKKERSQITLWRTVCLLQASDFLRPGIPYVCVLALIDSLCLETRAVERKKLYRIGPWYWDRESWNGNNFVK